LPGYLADPTVKKFDDTYYIYATTLKKGNDYYMFTTGTASKNTRQTIPAHGALMVELSPKR
jgi:hypothetical protein